MNETIRKVAVFLIMLGPETAGPVLKMMPETLIEQITASISRIGQVGRDEKKRVLQEFVKKSKETAGIEFGGQEYARSILEATFGAHKATSMLDRATNYTECQSFEHLRNVDPLTVANYLKNEHVQTVAVVLAYMDPRDSGPILAMLPPAMQGDVSHRMAILDKPNQETLALVEQVLGRQIQAEFNDSQRTFGGKKQVAEVLNEIAKETWQEILDEMREIDDEVATDVKNLMFVFEDIEGLDDRYIQEILKEIDGKELTMALKGATEEITDKIFRNMSKRAALGIREDMEYMGAVRVADVQDAQARIVEVVRSLEEAGTIVLGKGGAGAEMVS
ncbi:MAG: flagellar motor switch protein FliG [bacterium]